MDFSLWGYVKDSLYIPPLPASLYEPRHRINDADMLSRIWDELPYRLDIRRVTAGSHIGYL
jgi:hypothetical protein